jgi:hypothetical protein
MPEPEDKCVAKAEKGEDNAHVRTKKLSNGKYIHFCFQDHGPTTHGNVQTAHGAKVKAHIKKRTHKK